MFCKPGLVIPPRVKYILVKALFSEHKFTYEALPNCTLLHLFTFSAFNAFQSTVCACFQSVLLTWLLINPSVHLKKYPEIRYLRGPCGFY